eukprot:GDKK01031702.1.p1 GENE.GDKK01031702.1~~GDKK01031702.1.p1  ORF type:complete len:210 (-),score=23.97 GDKK01031702.1:63-650(-)
MAEDSPKSFKSEDDQVSEPRTEILKSSTTVNQEHPTDSFQVNSDKNDLYISPENNIKSDNFGEGRPSVEISPVFNANDNFPKNNTSQTKEATDTPSETITMTSEKVSYDTRHSMRMLNPYLPIQMSDWYWVKGQSKGDASHRPSITVPHSFNTGNAFENVIGPKPPKNQAPASRSRRSKVALKSEATFIDSSNTP